MTESLPSLRLTILAASQSGNAIHVAEVLKERISGIDRYHVEMVEEGSIPDLGFPDTDVLLLVVATHGEGELPDPFMPTFEALVAAAADLSHLRYGVIALGDITYHQTFCGAGRLLDATLSEHGAVRIGQRCEIDASTQPFADEDALTWMEEWLPLL